MNSFIEIAAQQIPALVSLPTEPYRPSVAGHGEWPFWARIPASLFSYNKLSGGFQTRFWANTKPLPNEFANIPLARRWHS